MQLTVYQLPQVRDALLGNDQLRAEQVLLGLVNRFMRLPPHLERTNPSTPAARFRLLARWRRNVTRHLVVGDALALFSKATGTAVMPTPARSLYGTPLCLCVLTRVLRVRRADFRWDRCAA